MDALVVEEDAQARTARGNFIKKTIPNIVFNMVFPCSIGITTVTTMVACWKNGLINWYTWHILLAGIGINLLMPVGISMLHGGHYVVERTSQPDRKTTHWLVQSVAGLCILTGVLVQYVSRGMQYKPHFISIHSIMGLFTVLLIIVGMASGLVVLYGWEIRKHLRPLWRIRMHRATGLIGYLTGTIALALAYKKHIFDDLLSAETRLVLILANGLAAVISLFGVWKKLYRYLHAFVVLRADHTLDDVQ